MNKILISFLSLTGVGVVSTGSYFLLRGNIENSEQKVNDGQGSGVEGGGEGESGASDKKTNGVITDSARSPGAVESHSK